MTRHNKSLFFSRKKMSPLTNIGMQFDMDTRCDITSGPFRGGLHTLKGRESQSGCPLSRLTFSGRGSAKGTGFGFFCEVK